MLQCIFLLPDLGEVTVEKQMVAHSVDHTICGWFWDYIVAHAAGGPYNFLSRVADVLIDYLGDLNEDVIKDNFVIVYQILDEMMDNGFPLTTEPNILKEMIAPPNIANRMLHVVTSKSSTLGSKLPDAIASFIPWRTIVVKYASNEVYVNIVEELDACINSLKKSSQENNSLLRQLLSFNRG